MTIALRLPSREEAIDEAVRRAIPASLQDLKRRGSRGGAWTISEWVAENHYPEIRAEFARILVERDKDAAAIRRSTIKECWEAVNAMIVHGPLDGNGCDPSAQRNGVILAANKLFFMANSHLADAPDPTTT